MCELNEVLSVRRAVERADMLYPNVLPFTVKADWLRELDMRLIRECLSRYEDGIREEVGDYSEAPDTPLVAGEAFSGLYTAYIAMALDIVNTDIERYENSSALFNSQLLEYMKYINRTHKALGVRINIE